MKKILYLFTIVAVLFNTGCDDQLNQFPEGVKTAENVIKNSKDAELTLNGAYYCFAEAGKDYYGNPSNRFFEINETISGMMSGVLSYRWGAGDEEDNKFTYESWTAEKIWTHYYKIISAANATIDGTSQLKDDAFAGDRKKEILGEAYFLRAYSHHALLMYFGKFRDINSKYGVFIRDKFIKSTEIIGERATVSKSYEFILSDIDKAISNAPQTNEKYYVTTWAAKLLKARILISRGIDTDYEDVVSITNDIIKNGPFSLEVNVKDVFAKGLESNEVILGIKDEKTSVYKNMNYQNEMRWQYRVSERFKELMKNDPRQSWMINADGKRFSKFNGDYIETCYVMRLTEAYLLQAEAIARNNGDLSQAKNTLKLILEKAGITDMSYIDQINHKDIFLVELCKEIYKNLGCENMQEWFGLLRLPLTEITKIKTTITEEKQLILPIPKLELQRNYKMIQNPGYKTINE